MRDEHTCDTWCKEVKESWHKGMAGGSGGWEGEDARGCRTLVERVISRKSIISTNSKKKGKGTLS